MTPLVLALGLLLSPAPMTPPSPTPPDVLWDTARVALDHERDAARARPILERLAADHPDTPAGRRATATLKTLDELGPAAPTLWAMPEGDEAAFVERYPDGPVTALVALRHSTTLPEAQAIALLDRYQRDEAWGWVIDREIGRRLYVEGRYIDAWRAADAAGDEGRVTKSLRMIAWRAALVLLVVGIAGALWFARRRRRAGAGDG